MFDRILIANRGEIACRIARTCRRLGIESVAVHSRADAGAVHARAADHVVALDGAGIADGYLDMTRLVDAARRTGAQAIHPGYGFLSENADFAVACAAAGIRFIGPDADTIRAMGDKARARQIAREVGVPVVPGVEEGEPGAADRDAALAEAAAGLVYPLMVKACAGGGGRGMRRVERPADLAAAIALARREARAGFGDDRLIVERCIERPRHVEVQVLGDAHGALLHLHERDCSIQRRHQKLVEEAPAPGLAGTTRTALHEAALALARAIGYRNAGTVEFILDPDDQSFHFLEMNTRLQVEHPVTEAILGLDLVEWQIRIAAGEPLPFAQEALVPRGWAIEARVNAEDPAHDFRPATGTVVGYREPAGDGVRVDSGVAEDSRVEPHYDALLAKVVVHGRDRTDAAARLADALDAFAPMGVHTNAAFLADAARRPAFVDGDVSTDFIAEQSPRGWQPASGEPALAAAWWLAATASMQARDRGPWQSLTGFRVLAGAGHPGRWRWLLVDFAAGGVGAPFAVWAEAVPAAVGHEPPDPARGADLRLARADAGAPAPDVGAAPVVTGRMYGEPHRGSAEGGMSIGRWSGGTLMDGLTTGSSMGRPEGGTLYLERDGRRTRLRVLERDGVVHLYGAGGWQAFRVLDTAEALRAGGATGDAVGGPLAAPVPGVVVKVEVAVGDEVVAGTALVVLESMKMYQTLSAPSAARVSAVHCAAGDAVAVGQALVSLDALAPPEPPEPAGAG